MHATSEIAGRSVRWSLKSESECKMRVDTQSTIVLVVGWSLKSESKSEMQAMSENVIRVVRWSPKSESDKKSKW